MGRDAAGSWSSPAFYSLGSGSFGLQAGIQDLQMLMLIMNDRALNAVLDSQFKFGADASLAVANVRRFGRGCHHLGGRRPTSSPSRGRAGCSPG